MIINISYRKKKLSPALRSKIETWLEQVQAHHGTLSSAQVTLNNAQQGGAAEAIIHTHGHQLVAKAQATNLYAALDAVSAKLERQLEKLHTRQSRKKGICKSDNISAFEA